jgi:hypothetical protein
MRTATNHFDDDDYQPDIDSYTYSGDREENPFANWRNPNRVRFYLPSSYDNLCRFNSDREKYINQMNEIYKSIVEPDMADLVAYWHEKEESQ